MAPAYKLYYFNLKGLAEPVRILFAYAGVQYEDIRIERPNWPNHKPTFPWEKVPVLEVNGTVLAQSNAILRFLGKQYSLAGENEFESAKCDEMIKAMTELRAEGTKEYLEKDPAQKQEVKSNLLSTIFPKYFSKWNVILEKNGGFLVGKRLTYADIGIASYLRTYNETYGQEEDIFQAYPFLKAHQDLVFNLPGIKEWIAKRPNSNW